MSIAQQELLESRIALTVSHVEATGDGLLNRQDWITIYSDAGSDIYVQQVPPAEPGQDVYLPALIYADNASFLDHVQIDDINSFSHVLATNGTAVDVEDELGRPAESDGYPFSPEGSFTTIFVLNTDDVDEFESIDGILSNGVGGRWSFQNTPGPNGYVFNIGAFSPLGIPSGPSPRSALVGPTSRNQGLASGDWDALFTVTWDTNTVDASGMSVTSPPVVESISYDWADDNGGPDFRRNTFGPIEASSPDSPSFTLPINDAIPTGQATYEVVDGSLQGRITITQWGGQVFEFRTLSQFPEDDPLAGENGDENIVRDANGDPVLNPAGEPLRRSTLVFRPYDPPTPVEPWLYAQWFPTTGADDVNGVDGRIMRGILNYVGGRPVIELEFFTSSIDVVLGDSYANVRNTYTNYDPDLGYYDCTALVATILGPQEVGRVQITAQYGIYNEPIQFVGGNFTFYDGQDFALSLTVDLLAPGATISIESPLLFQEGVSPVNHYFDLRAGNTLLEAQMESGTSFNLRNSRYGRAKAERLVVNANNAAKTYDIRVQDDVLTDNRRRSEIFVSTTGSLVGDLLPGILPVNSESTYMICGTGDVFIEGTVASNYQSYILQSPAEFAGPDDPFGILNRAPYYLTTRARISGADTGRLRGQYLAVTLGNDTPTFYDDTPNGGSTAFNIVNLQTAIDSIRIQASDRAGNPLQIPFPYQADIVEQDDLRVDGVASSSLPLRFEAAQKINWNATLLSYSDVTALSVGSDLILNAPLTTNFGKISLEADRLDIMNSVRVLDTFSDESSLNTVDISLYARAGDMKLTGPISAVNTISIVQDVATDGTGSVSGDARVITERLDIRAQGAVDIKTDVGILTGSADGGLKVDELNSIDIREFLVESGSVSIVANGYDAVDDSGSTIAALRGTLPNTKVLTASAPRGSVEVYVGSADNLTLGNASEIRARTAQSMLAMGSVLIESFGGDITVLDAPFAGSSAIQARLVSNAADDPLDGTYVRRSPGTFGDLLQGRLAGRLVIDGVEAKIRDVVFLAAQGNAEENGLYVVVNPGSATVPWVLSRPALYDQTLEVPVNLRVTASEGRQAGQTFVVTQYDNELGVTPRRVDVVTNSYFADDVRCVSTDVLVADYALEPISGLRRITGVSDGTIPLFDGVQPQVGDIVLVRMGTKDGSGNLTQASNGVYTVSSVGSSLNPFELTELTNEVGDAIQTGVFKAVEGSLRAKLTGNAYRVTYDSLGWAPMQVARENDSSPELPFTATQQGDGSALLQFVLDRGMNLPNVNDSVRLRFAPRTSVDVSLQVVANDAANGTFDVVLPASFEVEPGRFVNYLELAGISFATPTSVVTGSAAYGDFDVDLDATLATRIGSQDQNDTVTFVTSTNLGTNTSLGSLGKMITLYNQNSYIIVEDPEFVDQPTGLRQKQSFAFGTALGGEIRLSQELPRLVRPIVIDALAPRVATGGAGSNVISIDGSTISRTRQNKVVDLLQTSVDGFEFVTSASTWSQNSDGSILRGVVIGGFSSGSGDATGTSAAVQLTGVNGVLVDEVTIGQITRVNPVGLPYQSRLGNRYGILIDAAEVPQSAAGYQLSKGVAGFTTISDTKVYLNQTGIAVNGSESVVRFEGMTVGSPTLENQIGVDLRDGSTIFGMDSSAPSVRRITATRASDTSFTVPASLSSLSLLYEGLGVQSADITPADGTVAARIVGISNPSTTGRVTITIADGTVAAGIASLTVNFGSFTSMEAGLNSISFPVGVRLAEVFLGQTVSGTGLPGGTTITGIDAQEDPVTKVVTGTLTLSNTANATAAPQAITLESASRNAIQNNGRGAILRNGGSVTPDKQGSVIANTDISGSVFDGVLFPVNTVGRHRIGSPERVGVGGRSTSKDITLTSNAIFGNGGAGIRINRPYDAATAPVIRGNRLGVTSGNALNINKAGNIVVPTNSQGVPSAGFAGYFGPITNPAAQPYQTVNAGITYSRRSAADRVLVISQSNHGLATGDTVFLQIRNRFGVVRVSSVFTVTRLTDGTFSILLTAQQNTTLNQGSGFAANGNGERVLIRVTLSEVHELAHRFRVWIAFRNSATGVVQQAARRIYTQSLAGTETLTPNQFLVDSPGPTVGVAGTVEINRYGRQLAPFAAHLAATGQRDYEGNLHGPDTDSPKQPGGGVVTYNPIVPPPIRR